MDIMERATNGHTALSRARRFRVVSPMSCSSCCFSSSSPFFSSHLVFVDGSVERVGQLLGRVDRQCVARRRGRAQQLLKVARVRGGVPPQDGAARVKPQRAFCDGDVGEQHELFHERVRLLKDVRLDVRRVLRFLVQRKPHLRRR